MEVYSSAVLDSRKQGGPNERTSMLYWDSNSIESHIMPEPCDAHLFWNCPELLTHTCDLILNEKAFWGVLVCKEMPGTDCVPCLNNWRGRKRWTCLSCFCCLTAKWLDAKWATLSLRSVFSPLCVLIRRSQSVTFVGSRLIIHVLMSGKKTNIKLSLLRSDATGKSYQGSGVPLFNSLHVTSSHVWLIQCVFPLSRSDTLPSANIQ